MKTALTHKEMTKHIRSRIAASGIAARVKMADFCGQPVIVVCVPAYGIEFTEAQQREIRTIAKVNRLTSARGMEIDVDRMTDPAQVNFEFHA